MQNDFWAQKEIQLGGLQAWEHRRQPWKHRQRMCFQGSKQITSTQLLIIRRVQPSELDEMVLEVTYTWHCELWRWLQINEEREGIEVSWQICKNYSKFSKDEKEEMISVSLQLQKNLFASSQQQATSGPLGQWWVSRKCCYFKAFLYII